MKHVILSICLLTINILCAQVGVPRSPDLEAVSTQPIYVIIPEDTASQSYQIYLAFMKYWTRSKTISMSEQEFLRNPDGDKVYFRTVKGYANFVNTEFRLDTTLSYYSNHAGIFMLSEKVLRALENDKRVLMRDYEFLMEFTFNEDITTRISSNDRLVLKNRIQQTESFIDSGKSRQLRKDFADENELPKLIGDTLLIVFRDRIPRYERITYNNDRSEIDETIESFQEALSRYYHYPFKIIPESQLNLMAQKKRPHYYLHFTDLRVYTRPWPKKQMQYSIVNSLTGSELLRGKCSTDHAGLMVTEEWMAIISRIYKGMGVLKQYKRELAKDRAKEN